MTFDWEKIERDAFTSSMLVGNCPNCGSINTHDCKSLEKIPPMEIHGIKFPPMEIGSDCPIALKLDDPTVGHCDTCGYLWCLECGKELSEDQPICGHWEFAMNVEELTNFLLHVRTRKKSTQEN